MDVQLIACNLVEFPKVDGDLRSFSREFAQNLAVSIKAEGMLNPIVVRPHPAKPGHYLGVAGKHRHYAVGKVLKEESIEAKVIADMDDTDAEMAMIAENLWRNPLTKNQHLKAIKRWWEHFAAKNPEKVRAKSAGSPEPKAAESQAQIEPGAEAEPAAEGAAGPNFDEMVSAATGKSLASTKRDTRLARSFTEEQLEALEQMKVTQGQMTTIARIKDEVKRGEVVNLIASGMEVEDALKEVLKDGDVPTPADGQSKETREAKRAAKEEKAAELSDDEWFETYCGEKARMLGDPAKYKADALLFRRVSDLRHAFRSKGKKFLAETKKAGITGAFFNLINRFISVSHPKDWLLCDQCKGTCNDPKGGKCSKCYGGGYLLRTEQFL